MPCCVVAAAIIGQILLAARTFNGFFCRLLGIRQAIQVTAAARFLPRGRPIFGLSPRVFGVVVAADLLLIAAGGWGGLELLHHPHHNHAAMIMAGLHHMTD